MILTSVKHKPENSYFHWEISGKIESSHWQQLLRQIPYEELEKFLKENGSVKHEVTQC